MPSSLECLTPNLTAWTARFSGAPRIVREELMGWANRTVLRGERTSKELVRTDTHFLQRSIQAQPVTFAGGIARGSWGTPDTPEARVNEFGRQPGAPMPPSGVILPWMGRKSIDPRLEFVLRRAIGIKGIPAKSFIHAALARIRGEAEQDFANVAHRIIVRLRGL